MITLCLFSKEVIFSDTKVATSPLQLPFLCKKNPSMRAGAGLRLPVLITFKFDASLDDCWAKSGYQDETIVNQGFIFPKPYGDGICDEKLNIYECNFDGGDCCQAVTRDFRCYEEGCNCHLFGLPAPSIFGDTEYFSEK